MRTLFQCALFFSLIGASLGTTAIQAQITNPTFAILSLEQYRDYYSFFMLGSRLEWLSRLGHIAALLVAASFTHWAVQSCALDRYLSYSARGERFSWSWRTLSGCAVAAIGLLAQAFGFAILAADLVGHSLSWYHLVLLVFLVTCPLQCIALLNREVPEHRVLMWPLGFLALVALGVSVSLIDVAWQVEGRVFAIPPLVSTYFGPWGVLGWAVLLFGFLGLASGSVLLGLKPRPDCEPSHLSPLDARNLRISSLVSMSLAVFVLASYPLYFVPRYQVSQSLQKILKVETSMVPGRTVVWLDSHDPAHSIPAFETLSTPANLSLVEAWIVSAPSPSALTRPAAKILADQEIWMWRPEAALDWLELHRRRQTYSNLNRAILEVVDRTKPSPKKAKYLDSLLNRDRCAWPGPGSRMELAKQLRRYSRSAEAQKWVAEAGDLGANLLDLSTEVPATGVIRGRLQLDGQALPGAKIALFRGEEAQELLERSRRHVKGEQQLLQQDWIPRHYQYLDLDRLCNLYSVETTDHQGYFRFDDAEVGLYRLAVRLPEPAEFERNTGLISLIDGGDVDLGTLEMNSQGDVLESFPP